MKPRYKIVQTPRFERNFRKLSSESRRGLPRRSCFLKPIRLLESSLHGELKGLSSLRVGSYRVVYEIQHERIILHMVGHRRAAYRN